MAEHIQNVRAVGDGVVRDVIERAKAESSSVFASRPAPILFIDEIHRFNKAQQDALLGAVEDGTVVLIGATTENPSFEVINPLLSRCQVFVLKPLGAEDLRELAAQAYRLTRPSGNRHWPGAAHSGSPAPRPQPQKCKASWQ